MNSLFTNGIHSIQRGIPHQLPRFNRSEVRCEGPRCGPGFTGEIEGGEVSWEDDKARQGPRPGGLLYVTHDVHSLTQHRLWVTYDNKDSRIQAAVEGGEGSWNYSGSE